MAKTKNRVENNNIYNFNYYIRRFFAFIVDWYLSTLLAAIPVFTIQSILNNDLILENTLMNLSLAQSMVVTGIALIIYILYFCWFPLSNLNNFEKGQTVGKKLFKLKIVKRDNKELTFFTLFIREFIGILILQGILTSCSIYIMSITQNLIKIDIVPYFQSFYYAMIIISLILLLTRKHTTIQDYIARTKIINATTYKN